jgi:hypothetical protein
MENKSLIEIRNNLVILPVLQERLKKLRHEISHAEENVQLLLRKYEAEALDVEQIKKDSLSTTILKLIGKYGGKVTKETEEMLAAKMEYDKASGRVKELQLDRDDHISRISILSQQKQIYEAELEKREQIIKSNVTGETSIKYRQLEAEQDLLSRQLVEIGEALRAANKVISTADSAMGHLDSAESWATFDVWTRGGIFSHMAKYDHIDDAQADSNRLDSQMKDLQKELLDINFSEVTGFSGIDGATRVIDFWFDNIFTDLNVRDRIRDDNERLGNLRGKINGIINNLDNNKSDINRKLNELEIRKNDLIISG